MKFDIITIFPKIFDSYFNESIVKRAKETGKIEINVHNLRDYTTDKHKKVDDTPYGGGAGMVMQVRPIYNCVQHVKSAQTVKDEKNTNSTSRTSSTTRTILFSAKGNRFTQEDAKRLSQYDNLVMICGRYEGVDERVAENIADEEISIGDFVLTGGEIPAMVVADSVSRLLPGVLGNKESAIIESHSEDGYLEHPQYTKPEDFNGWKVPEILLSGNHADIDRWKKEKSKNIKTKTISQN